VPRFSEISAHRLETCHPRLQTVFNEVIEHFDCTILEGHRSVHRQAELVRTGFSQTMNSRHLPYPSQAVDVAPYPVNWKDRERFHLFAGFVLGVASQMGVELRWGGDWDQDTEVSDNGFDDLPHFELVNPGPVTEEV